MNHIYKVVWNHALSCFTAVGEYAKTRDKSSKSSVSSNATINTTSSLSSINTLRLSAIGLGLLAAGFTISPQVFSQVNVGGGTGDGTAISSCKTDSTEASADGSYSVAIGCDAEAGKNFNLVDRGNPSFTWTGGSQNDSGSTAIGTGTQAGDVATALGTQAKAIGQSSVAIGAAAFSNGNTSLALGRQSAATANFAQAIGNVSSATGEGSLAVGHSALASGRRGIAIGSTDFENAGTVADQPNVGYRADGQTQAIGSDTIAFGSNAKATADNSLAFGAGSKSEVKDAIALGSKSIANRAGGFTGFVPLGADSAAIQATNSTVLGAVSVGTGEEGGNRQIVNVAAGTNDSDAVNVAQLTGLQNGINSTLDQGMDFGGDNGTKVNRKFGEELLVKGGETDSTKLASGNNIGVVANGTDTLTIKLAKNLTGLTSVTTGDTLLNIGGVSFLGGSSVKLSSNGLNNGGNRITGVASGVGNNTNAANIGDVNRASAAARTQVLKGTNVSSVDFSSDSITGQDVYTVNADGTTTSAGSTAVTVIAGDKDTATNMTDYAVDLSETSKASLVKADSAMQTIITQIDGSDIKTLDQTENTANFLTGDNIVLTAENGGIKVATAEDVAFTSMTTGNTLLNTGGVSFLGDSSVRLSSNGLNNGGNRITGVAAGADDKDAVNVSQLKATNSTVDLGLDFTGDDTAVVVNRQLGKTLTIQGGATDLTENNVGVVADDAGNLNVRLAKDVVLGATGSVRMESTVLNNSGITITDGPNETITLSNEGLDNGNNRITKVAKGVAPSDAVNFAQLTTTNDEIAKGIKIGDGNSDNDQQFALGDTINVTGDTNLTTVASATGVQVRLNNQLDLGDAGRMQIGNSIMNSTGFTFMDRGEGRTVMLSSRGLDNGGNPIRNVGKGTLNTDAVNVEQLREVTIALDQGWGITAQGDIATMVKQGDTIDMNSRDGNIKVSRTLASNAAVSSASTGLIAAATPVSPNDISFDLNPDINVVSVTAGDTTINDNGLTIAGGPSITKSGIDAADNKIINIQNGEIAVDSQDAINGRQLYAQGSGISSIIGGNTLYNPVDSTFTNSNIGGTGEGSIDGAIASIRQGTVEINENVQNHTTAITTNTTNIATNTTNISTNTTNIQANKDRLDAGFNFGADSGGNINKPVGDDSVLTFKGGHNITTTAEGSSIKFDLNGNIDIDSVTTGNTTINNNGITMVGGPSMTASGINAAGNKITNVADGMAPQDAVNFGQLDAVSRRLGDGMNELGYKIGEVEDDANAGISAAMAMSSLPQAYIIGKSMIGGGVGTYNGESAVAIGLSKLSNDGRWVMKLNGTADTQGNAGASIGAGFHFD